MECVVFNQSALVCVQQLPGNAQTARFWRWAHFEPHAYGDHEQTRQREAQRSASEDESSAFRI